MLTACEKQLIDLARSVSHETIWRYAAAVDAENRFPTEAIEALRAAGLLAAVFPKDLGGLGVSLPVFKEMNAWIGESCLSTGMIFASHGQQVTVLAKHAKKTQEAVLREVAEKGVLISSVTSEYGKGGNLLASESPLYPEGDRVRVRRRAPIVSYGVEAPYALISMKASETSDSRDGVMVLVSLTDEGSFTVTGGWDSMGMRGTRSVPMVFDFVVPKDRVIGEGSYREVAVATMIPFLHVGWAAMWYGAARGALRRFVTSIRSNPSLKKKFMESDLFISRLADLRLQVDLMGAILEKAAEDTEQLYRSNAPLSQFEDPTYQILINNVKTACANLSFQVLTGLIEVAGVYPGYLKSSDTGIERVFRDLRAASIQFHNDRLNAANGKIQMFERVGG